MDDAAAQASEQEIDKKNDELIKAQEKKLDKAAKEAEKKAKEDAERMAAAAEKIQQDAENSRSVADKMEADAMAYINRIAEMGGIIPAIEAGFPQKEIAEHGGGSKSGGGTRDGDGALRAAHPWPHGLDPRPPPFTLPWALPFPPVTAPCS